MSPGENVFGSWRLSGYVWIYIVTIHIHTYVLISKINILLYGRINHDSNLRGESEQQKWMCSDSPRESYFHDAVWKISKF